ncbi:C4-type zinc ribbon domain-containing protein [Fluviicola sp.]|jgi:predicted  nucleic acid-binding Zn-ribbon protein|uniref:zinc ribbon domain-containing protein n=1 Tax=Fluviicola sp. TaxID=1917219 RepID=UPI00281A3D2C|nr:C4-type zinc ribbon domain-containing protein [Fluviicola sp.]MDR0802719.1 C4-type zinc ribbon domain-containing protein [Fluviicola sp.]
MAAKASTKETTVAEKLDALYALQKIDSQIDKIRTVRGELPLEVQDLEDEIEGLETRIKNLQDEVKELETEITDRKLAAKDAEAAIVKFKEQQNNVRNNREFESLSKEIEYQELEIKLHDKRSKEAKVKIVSKKEVLEEAKERLDLRKGDLKVKQDELNEIVGETRKEEEELIAQSEKAKALIDARLIAAYDRLRMNAKNGLAVVGVDRDSCGGCFNKIPPQRQLDIDTRRKVIVCEHCGRILVPADVVAE